MLRWKKHKLESSLLEELSIADDTTLMAESEELKSRLMKVKEESEKFGLKLNIQKTKIMASGPITSWESKISTLCSSQLALLPTAFLTFRSSLCPCDFFSLDSLIICLPSYFVAIISNPFLQEISPSHCRLK